VAVVVVTRNRLSELLTTLGHLRALPEKPRTIVVDNASSDGTAEAVGNRYPEVEVIPLDENIGAAGRNVGVERAETPYAAFSDDDSWWAPGSLARATRLLEAHANLGLIAARILIGSDQRLDPTCAEMARSPLRPSPGLPGRPILGFVACGAVVRRSAYLEVGGFDPHLGIGGEEQLLALDLAAAGWQLAYVDEVVAHHHPWAGGARSGARHSNELRNMIWATWLRRPARAALARTATLAAASLRARRPGALVDALRGLPWTLRERRALPPDVEHALRRLAGSRGHRRRHRLGTQEIRER
jgi:GT2 family glycosyltransferase